MRFSDWLEIIQHILRLGYMYVMPVLIVGWSIFKNWREIIIRFIIISNGWFSAYAALYFGISAIEVLDAWYSQNQYEGYTFYYSRTNLFSPYGFAFWLQFLIIPLSILFLFAKFRRSILTTVIIIVCLLISSERFILFISRSYGDYLSSSWSFIQPQHWWQTDSFSILMYLFIIISTYVFQQRGKIIRQRL